MHFRHFLITGLMVGAAMFLPNQAFAEKNDSSGLQTTPKEFVHGQSSAKSDQASEKKIPVKANSTKSQGKSIAPNSAQSNQGGAKQQNSNSTPQQTVAHKPTALPIQAKVNTNHPTKKAEISVNSRGNGKGAAIQEAKREVVQETKASVKGTVNSDKPSLHNDTVAINKTRITRDDNWLPSQQKGSYVPLSKKESSFDPPVKEPLKQGPIPESKEEIPKVNQMWNSNQRTNSSGGQSNDRGNQGLSTLSMMDKWFEWNKLHDITLIQPYHSRITWMIHQWENAPPSPPPQTAPLLETVTRS
ncbi:hypothetical protein [Neobacillus sp. PS2-9]|uniref:hypothetical protein n=1 Tax=Neobacillus sp. PS2-9 TaxID=3070676 RepID=UPI0027DEBAC7|nr:hypothetical protein [Neobacillus sp. PS2-9]WML58951.1 hypothetical protein RCG25_03895 [Neobacillus sp. PS2-9]